MDLRHRSVQTPSRLRTSSSGLTRPALMSRRPCLIAAMAFLSAMISRVSCQLSNSCADMSTASGRPFFVITTCSWMVDTSSTIFESSLRASVRGSVFISLSVQDSVQQLERTPGCRNEERRVRVQRVPVGHARDVVGYRALGAVALRDLLMLGGHALGVLLEILEQIPQHALGLLVLGLRGACEVDVLEHEL